MAVQGEWEQGGLGLCFNVKSMAQAKITVQGTPKQVDHLPQPNPESVMGAGAAARKHPQQQAPLPVPSKTAHHNGGSIQLSPLEMKQLMEMITQMGRAWGMDRGRENGDATGRRLRTNERECNGCPARDGGGQGHN